MVNDLDQNIAPAVNVDGIYFVRTVAGDTISIDSDTGTFDIVTTGAGVGIYAQADGTITIDQTGDIYAATPAEAGVQCFSLRFAHWIPAFAGMTST